ncbi:MAG: tryptophan-rich sensory protein [Candidatus Micrarchaeota archaeon]|nr:tryptophan-rich sensory protein [Candidatus Micrarchaeota archaeon]
MKTSRALGFIVAVAKVEIIGNIGTIFALPAIGAWYSTLIKPAFTPPAWAFGPAWLILFALMGVSLYLVWEKGTGKKRVRRALYAFGVQMALNVLWSILFFGLRSPLLGLIDILLLLVAIVFTALEFYRVDRAAAYLLIPYLLWVAFATLLNISVWLLN